MIADSNIYTSVEYLHRCRSYTSQWYDSYHRSISSNIATRGGLLGQGSVDGIVGSGTIGGVGVTTGSCRTDEKTSTLTRRWRGRSLRKRLATRSSTTGRNACQTSLRARSPPCRLWRDFRRLGSINQCCPLVSWPPPLLPPLPSDWVIRWEAVADPVSKAQVVVAASVAAAAGASRLRLRDLTPPPLQNPSRIPTPTWNPTELASEFLSSLQHLLAAATASHPCCHGDSMYRLHLFYIILLYRSTIRVPHRSNLSSFVAFSLSLSTILRPPHSSRCRCCRCRHRQPLYPSWHPASLKRLTILPTAAPRCSMLMQLQTQSRLVPCVRAMSSPSLSTKGMGEKAVDCRFFCFHCGRIRIRHRRTAGVQDHDKPRKFLHHRSFIHVLKCRCDFHASDVIHLSHLVQESIYSVGHPPLHAW